MSNAILERPLTIDEAAEFLRLKKSYIYKLVTQKKISHYKPRGGYLFFKQSELHEFTFKGKVNADYEVKQQAEKVLSRGRNE
ncbi:MAG: helix-turn-helix domain-containing protein [Spirochaetes bacterium]|nr:helix-turn-helix domain-containing protein [Spirochaetota bacterium]